jgi:hypothetical protein
VGGFLRGVLGRRGASGADREGAEEELARAKKELKQTKRVLERTRRDLKQKRRQLKRTARANVLLRVPEGSVCAEIGVDEGVFSRQILDTVSPRRLHLIDPWKHHDEDEYRRSRYGGLGPGGQGIMDERYEEVRARFAEEVQAGRVTFHRNFSNEIADEFEDSYFDWVYVDGNHHYEFVRQDLKLYYPKVKPGGFIAGDDYGSRGWWDNGVQKAVDEFVSQRPDLTLEVHGTQFVIQKPERASPADEPVKADLALREIAQRTGKMPEGRLPDFLLIGAQKCGTGFLFRLLSQHPRVEPAVIKEVGFFSNHFEKGLEWYRSCFPAPAHEDGRPVWTWEASPNDLFYPHAPGGRRKSYRGPS